MQITSWCNSLFLRFSTNSLAASPLSPSSSKPMLSIQTTLQPPHSCSPASGPKWVANRSLAYSARAGEARWRPRSWLPGRMIWGIGGAVAEK